VTRVVVIGGGGAAIRACHAAAERGARVTLISKGAAAASGCTLAVDSKIEFSVVNWPMPDPDTPSTYAADLQAIGRGLKGPERLRLFAERSVDEIALLERLGLPLEDAGSYRRVQLAGSSYPRGIVCPSRFGARALQALWAATRRARVKVLDRTMALEILAEGGRARGVLACDLRTGGLRAVAADAVVLAAGGAGNLFSLTTNPKELTGDGYALASRAGAALDHMEFIQYVVLTAAPIRGYFLLTSVLLRGALVDEGGARFEPADPQMLSPPEQKRLLADFMAWIAQRKRAAPGIRVFWDGTALGPDLARQMPKTCAAFARRGHDLVRRPVEVDLGAHQFLGGVVTDLQARSTIPNLFAAGDVADSVQGADRINGSGIMEALVFGAIAGARAAEVRGTARKPPAIPAAYGRRSPHPSGRLLEWRRRLASVMDEVLVVRDRERLSRLEPMLSDNLRELEDGGLVGETPATTRMLHELRSALTTALLVVRASRRRERDLGLFLTTRSR